MHTAALEVTQTIDLKALPVTALLQMIPVQYRQTAIAMYSAGLEEGIRVGIDTMADGLQAELNKTSQQVAA